MSDLSINNVSSAPSTSSNGGVADASIANGAKVSGTLGNPEESGLADFNQRAGVHPHRSQKTDWLSLQQRRLTQPQRRPPINQTNAGAHHDDEHLNAAALSAIDSLERGDTSSLEEHLENTYDVLERHALLRNARSQVDDKDLPQEQKDHLKDQLNEMLSDLMDQHGDVIRSGLQNAQSFSAALGAMESLSQANNDNHDPNSVHDLRSQFGSKGDGRLDAPLTPLALAYSLQTKFGVDNFSSALAELRSKMAADLRLNPASAPGPKLWLSLSDAATFNAVQSSFAIAGDLRRDLSERAGIAPAHHQSGTALALLNAAQTGANSADALVGQIIGRQEVGNMAKMQIYMLIRQAIDQLPTTIWSPDLLPQRGKLLEHLRSLSLASSQKIALSGTEEETLENKLRARVNRKARRDQDDEQEPDHPQHGASDEQGNPRASRKSDASQDEVSLAVEK